jgi:hypothetical protein
MMMPLGSMKSGVYVAFLTYFNLTVSYSKLTPPRLS